MNNKLENFKKEIKGKTVAVLGIGVSNVPAIEYLSKLGAKITARDKKETLGEECNQLRKLDIEFCLGENYLEGLDKYDYILRSPGVKPFLPQITNALKKCTKLISEIELLVELTPCKVIGITGSDGKTTTTALVAKFLEKAGYKVWLGGNIGQPIFSNLDEMKAEDIVVIELSSFQLMTMTKSPDRAAITNISPNHLDYHRDYEEYISAKSNIFLNQNKENILVLNQNDEITDKYLNIIKEKNILTSIRKFSVVDSVENGVCLKNGCIVSNVNGKQEKICEVAEVKIVGIHNLANICTAASLVIDLTGTKAIKEIITTFNGVEHRMEFIRDVNGVKWYNDSIASSPTRTIAGLCAFEQKIILVCGGYDKNIPYEIMGSYILDKVKVLLLIGKTAPKIEKAVIDEAKKRNIDLSTQIEIKKCTSLEECVDYASNISNKNDIVALSPASASFDMFKNFEERGNLFKKLVNNL